MSQEKTHDLHDFMRQLQDRMAAHYKQIQKRASEDPGTAGDQGEKNWAKLLRDWLPRTYEVVTKGRIIGQDGCISPQVDVLVLKSTYPKQLIDEGQKIFLAAGVAAAFECKTTLKAEHIEKAVKTCVEIKNLYPAREGTPYKELHAPIVYGLLAHSHSWKGANSTPEANIEQKLDQADYLRVSHPRQALDLLCVPDLAAWTLLIITFLQGVTVTVNSRRSAECSHIQIEDFTPIGALISYLWRRLAWEDPALRDLANYYHHTHIGGGGSGKVRHWQSNLIYTAEVFSGFGIYGPLTGEVNTWSEWFSYFG